MSQQRITLFFPLVSRKKTSPDAKCHFLELPFSIRRQIYHEAGLVSGKTIHMNFWATRKKVNTNRQDFDHGDDSHLPSLPLSLFAVCRLVNDELTRIFYGENRFAITRQAPRGLRSLERFSDSTLTKFRFLIIRVSLASCNDKFRERRCGNGNIFGSDPSSHDMFLSHASFSDQLIISQWQRICTRFSKSAQPGKLALYVICDCENRQTADMIVKPLLTLPILQDFGLRLARDYVEELQGVAKDTALRLTSRSPPQSLPPFKFLDLPKEIQLNILKHTRLVGGREISCRQNSMLCRGTCSVNGIAADITGPDSGLLKCFCCRGHSAFNFRCDHCESLGFPQALFLVSRESRDAAIEVFYGRNPFAVYIVDFVPSPAASAHINRSISIIPGLERFPKCSIRFFTSLKLKFEWSELEILQPGWNNWLNTVDLLSEEANLAVLNLEIQFSEKFNPSILDMPIETDSGYEKSMWDTYHRLIQPVTALRGLKNFFVHLNWCFICGVPGQGAPDGRREVEQKLERMVMGQEYDAWKCELKKQEELLIASKRQEVQYGAELHKLRCQFDEMRMQADNRVMTLQKAQKGGLDRFCRV